MLNSTTRPEGDLSAACKDAAEAGRRVVVTREGRPWVAIVPLDDLDWLEALEDAQDSARLRQARVEWEASGRNTASLDEVATRLSIEA